MAIEHQAEGVVADSPSFKLATPTKGRSKGFVLLNLLDEINATPEQIPWLVADVLPEVGVTMLCGKPKTGKSTFATLIAVKVAEGMEVLGKRTLQGDVLYLLLEGSKFAFTNHAIKMGYTGSPGQIHLVNSRMPPKTKDGLADLDNTIKEHPNIKLVIVDPGPKLVRFLDSYKPEEVQAALEDLEVIARTNKIQIMFLTHAKKKITDDPGDAAMGATAFRGGTDTNIFLRKQGQQRTITIEQRLGVSLEETFLSGWDEVSQTVTLGETVEDFHNRVDEGKKHKNTERIRNAICSELVSAPLGLSQSELLAKVTGKTQNIREELDTLVEGRAVSAKPDGKSIRYSYVGLQTELHTQKTESEARLEKEA